MATYSFERNCRTPFSESFTITDDERSVGRIDIHYASAIVYGTLCVLENLTQEAIRELIETIDDELVDSAGVVREQFIVHVFQGHETGVYSDHDFGEDGREEGS